jgi:cysteine desulfurase
LDCNATTPLDPVVREAMMCFLEDEFGNAGSRTHEFGARARQAVEGARRSVASLAQADAQDVIFTSGATESNNLAIRGLADYGERTGKKHLVTTAIEHKAVLEPFEQLERQGFEVTIVPVDESGAVSVSALQDAIRGDTLLISVMHANNETGVIQPVQEIAERLEPDGPYLHVDAAQTFGKLDDPLQHSRVDLISLSAHKIYGPKGVGALIARRRGRTRPPLQPLMHGGGQERGLRPGTLPVHLIVGLGEAAERAARDKVQRAIRCQEIRQGILEALEPLGVQFNGDQSLVLPHVLNCSVPGVDSEAAMLACKGNIAISNGSACTSVSYTPSHVLDAMGFPEDRIEGAMRLSWCHLTPDADWQEVITRPLERLAV